MRMSNIIEGITFIDLFTLTTNADSNLLCEVL